MYYVTVSSDWLSPIRKLFKWCSNQGYTIATEESKRYGKYYFTLDNVTQEQLDNLIAEKNTSGFANDVFIGYV